MIGLFVSPHKKHKGKGTWFDSVSSHLWRGALCDDTIKKQLCSGLMLGWNTYFKQEKQAFPFSRTLKSVVQLLKLPVGNNKQAHNQGSQWFCGWVKERVYIGLFSKQYTTWSHCVNNLLLIVFKKVSCVRILTNYWLNDWLDKLKIQHYCKINLPTWCDSEVNILSTSPSSVLRPGIQNISNWITLWWYINLFSFDN